MTDLKHFFQAKTYLVKANKFAETELAVATLELQFSKKGTDLVWLAPKA